MPRARILLPVQVCCRLLHTFVLPSNKGGGDDADGRGRVHATAA